MKRYILSNGGIFRPMSPEEKEFSIDSALSAPVVSSDFLSSISQIISPRRKQELLDLAELIANKFEQYVDTRIRRSQEVRPYRDADKFPHRQYHIEAELAYAYQLLNLLDTEKYPANYGEESLRLRKEVAEKTNHFSIMPTLGFTSMLRMAALKYMDAALVHIHREEAQQTIDRDVGETVRQVREAIELYRTLRKNVERLTLDDDMQNGLWEELSGCRSVEGLMEFVERYTGLKTEAGVQKGAAVEHFQWLLQGMYEQHTEDILFGEIRCHALLGDYDRLLETVDALEAFQGSGRYKPSRLIMESAAVIKQQAKNNLSDGGSSKLFVSNSSDEHAQYARRLVLNREVVNPQTIEQELMWVIDNS